MVVEVAFGKWLLTTAIVPDSYSRFVDMLKGSDGEKELVKQVKRECGFRPPRVFKRWLNEERTWEGLVAHTPASYETLINSLTTEIVKPLFQKRRTTEQHRVRATELVGATVGHFVQTRAPSTAVAITAQRISDNLDQGFAGIHEHLDRPARIGQQMERLPPAPRKVLSTMLAGDPSVATFLQVLDVDDPATVVASLTSNTPGWLTTGPPALQLAMAEMCIAHELMLEAANFLERAADAGLDRPHLYARAAYALAPDLDIPRRDALFKAAEEAGGGWFVDALRCAALDNISGVGAALAAGDPTQFPITSALQLEFVLNSQSLDRAIDFAPSIIAQFPEHASGHRRLAELLLGRGQVPGAVNRTGDNERALAEALRARDLIRKWSGPSGQAVALACQAALKLDDFAAARRIGTPAPVGDATLRESQHPDVGMAVAQISLYFNDPQAAFEAGKRVGGFQQAVIDAERLSRSDNADERTQAADAFERAWKLASTEIDKFAVWMGAAEAGIEPVPGEAELLARSDNWPLHIECQLDIAKERFASAIEKLRSHRDDERSVHLLIEAYQRNDRNDDALREMSTAATRFNNPTYTRMSARLLQSLSRDDEAATEAQKALLSLPAAQRTGRIQMHRILVSRAHKAGDWVDMEQRTRAWIGDAPDDNEIVWYLIVALYNQGKSDRAWQVLAERQLVPDQPERAQLWMVLNVQHAPRPELVLDILELQEQFEVSVAVANTAIGCFIALGDTKGEIDEELRSRWQLLLQTQAAAEDNTGIQMIVVSDDPAQALHGLDPQLAARAERLDEVASLAHYGHVPYGFLANSAGRRYALTLSERSAGCLTIASGPPTDVELDAARAAAGHVVVVDTSSLVVGSFVRNLWPQVTGVFSDITMTSPARFDIQASLASLVPRRAGTMVWDSLLARSVYVGADTVEQDRVEEQLVWVRQAAERVQTTDWARLMNSPPPGVNDESLLSWMGALDMAKSKGLALWCDDISLRAAALSQNVPAFGTVAVLEVLLERGGITGEERDAADRDLYGNYCTDLPMTFAAVLADAEDREWVGGPTLLLLTRPTTWAGTTNVAALWPHLIAGVARHDLGLCAQWVWTAANGVLTNLSRPTAELTLAFVLTTTTGACQFDARTFADCLAAVRAATADVEIDDVLPRTLATLAASLTRIEPAGVARTLFKGLGEHLSVEDQELLSQVADTFP